MRGLTGDLQQAWRNACHRPGRTAVLVLSLAFGIGAVVTMAAVCDGLLLRPPPFAGAERQYFAFRKGRAAAVEPRLDRDEFQLLRERAQTVEDVVGHCYMYMVLRTGGEPRYVSGVFLPANIFDFLGIQPWRGRGFVRGEDEPGAPDVCVISHEFWQRQFGGRDDVIGRTVVLDEIPRTIVGVTPPNTDFVRHHDLWLPLKFEQVRKLVSWSRGALPTVKLRPGVTRAQAAAELALLGARLQASDPGKYPQPWTLELAPQSREDSRRTPDLLARYGVLLGVALLVLVIACANVANLLLVQAAQRRHDFTVRSALGATRGRLIRQMLVESLLLTAAGTALGTGLSAGLLDFLWTSLATIEEPNWMRFTIDGRVLAGAAGIAAVVGLGVGLLPAWRASRLDLVAGLKDGGRGAPGLQLGRLSRVFVVLQVALACAVLTASAVALGSILLNGAKMLPFDADAFYAVRVQIRDSAYRTVAERGRFFSRLADELRARPEVAEAVLTSRRLDQPPGAEPVVRAEDRAQPLAAQPRALGLVCSPGYFNALRIPLLRGRDFSAADTADRPLVCIINTLLAERLFSGTDPLGRSVTMDGRNWTVIGLVPDLQEQGFASAPDAVGGACIYRAQGQAGFDFLTVLVRPRAGPPGALRPGTIDALNRVDASVPIFEALPWGEQIEQGMRFTRFIYRISLGFGLAALLLAGVGVYAVVAFTAQQRTTEIGIRMALGAAPADVLRLVVRDGVGQIGIGLGLGAGAAWSVARLLQAIIHPYPAGALKYLIVLGAVLGLALLAVLLPALRSSRLDPAKILRG